MSGPVITTAPERNGDDAAAGSLLSSLRAAARAQRIERHLDLAVGGPFGDQLVIRYHGLPVEELDRYAELSGRITNLSLSIDMMVSCVQTVLGVADGVETDLGVGLGAELWELLDFPLPEGVSLADITPREMVNALWHERGMALGAHVGALVAWQTEEGTTPGEPSAPTS